MSRNLAPGVSTLGALAALASCHGAPAFAANLPLSGLAPRGALAGTDLIPVLPSGGATLQAASAGDLKKYALTSIDTYGADPTGVADSTSAIQAAIASGQSLTCNGVYKISATLTLSTTASHGQTIMGGGATNAGGSVTAGRCVFKPAAGMTGAVFKVDGTPFGSWIQGFAFENLTVDMADVTDVSTNVAFNQVQAYDGSYEHVRVVNDGANKRAWLFSTGAYTTSLRDTQGNILDCEGTSTSNGATTITVLNHDGGSVISDYCNSLRFIGGTYQGIGNTKFQFRNGTDYQIETDVEGTGTFLNVDNTVNFLFSHTELQGFTGTYMIGMPGQSTILLDQQVNYNSYPFGLSVGGVTFNNQGAPGLSSFYSGASGSDYQVILGRIANDVLWGVASSANDLLPGTGAGDGVLTTLAGSSSLFLGGGDTPVAKLTASGFNTYGTGTMISGIVNVKPAADIDALTVQSHAGSYLVDFNTSAPLAEFVNGMGLIGYTGNFSGQSWRIITSSGEALFQQSVVQPALDGTSVFQINNAAAASVFSVSTNLVASNSIVTSAGSVNIGGTATVAKGVITPPMTVATLPPSPSAGQTDYVTDATICTFNSGVTGGGSTHCPVVYNGSVWVAG